MEIKEEKGLRILDARDGCVIQSVTDGSILGKRLVLGKRDSEIQYHEIPIQAIDEE